MAIEQLTLDRIPDTNKNYSKETPYNLATAFGFNWNKDKQQLAKDAGIQNYTWTKEQNIKIKNMLLKKLEELKNQANKDIIITTDTNLTNLQIETKKILYDKYDEIINALTIKEGKISLMNKDNIQISRNDWKGQRSSDIKDMPLIVDGKGILIKYTDPNTQMPTILAIDDFQNNTLVFRDVTNNENSPTMYSAPEDKVHINLQQADIIENRENLSFIEPKQISQIPNTIPEIVIPSTQIPPTSQIEPNPVSKTENNEIDTENISIETNQEQPLVLTEDLLQHYDSQHLYPGDPDWKTYAQVYQERYTALKKYWEGKTIQTTFPEDTEPTIGTIDFVGWVFDIVSLDGTTTTSIDMYELTPNYVVFYRGEGLWEEQQSKKYKLIIQNETTQDNTLVASIEPYQEDTKSQPENNIVSNEENIWVSWKNLFTQTNQVIENE